MANKIIRPETINYIQKPDCYQVAVTSTWMRRQEGLFFKGLLCMRNCKDNDIIERTLLTLP
jgi:hypothetical protein